MTKSMRCVWLLAVCLASVCGFAGVAEAQCTGVFATGTVCGASTKGLPTALPFSTLWNISVGGANPNAVPAQLSPFTQSIAVGGAYADSTSGNIFQISSYTSNSGTRPTVAVFGQATTTGSGAFGWGSNFVCLINVSGGNCIASELDVGFAGTATGTGVGLGINAVGTTNSNFNAAAQISTLASGATFSNGIRFFENGSLQPVTGSLIMTAGAINSSYGINFTSAAFATAAIATNGFLLDPNGTITSGVWHGSVIAAAYLTNPSPSTSTAGDLLTFSNSTGGLQDSGTLLTALMPKAGGTFSGTVTFADGSIFSSTGLLMSANLAGTNSIFPNMYGGSAASSLLNLISTSVSGTTDAIVFKTGNSVEAARILTNQVWKFGAASFTANGSTSLSLTNIGPSGAHATVQEWFTVQDSGGTTRYIPAF